MHKGALALAVALGLTTVQANSATAAAPAPAAKNPNAERLLRDADEITKTVAKIRGLSFKRKFKRGVLSKEEIGAQLKIKIAEEYSSADLAVDSKLLKRMGLVSNSFDYEQTIMKLLMEQVAGFYDPAKQTLYIADWLDESMQRPALAHEIEHALQDQHFDLKKIMKGLKGQSDLQLARAAIVEGDGMAVMTEDMLAPLGGDLSILASLPPETLNQMLESGIGNQAPEFDKAPKIIKKTLVFPYLTGMSFVAQLREKSWKKVNDVFKRLPASTEQVLHPEKYWAKEQPVQIKTAALKSVGAQKVVRTDTLGEYQLQVIFEESGLSAGEAKSAAAGWGGDRLVVYENAAKSGQPIGVVWASTWDSEDEAIEAFSAITRMLALAAPGGIANKPGANTVERTDAAGDHFSAELRGKNIVALFGVQSGAEVRTEVFQRFQFGKK